MRWQGRSSPRPWSCGTRSCMRGVSRQTAVQARRAHRDLAPVCPRSRRPGSPARPRGLPANPPSRKAECWGDRPVPSWRRACPSAHVNKVSTAPHRPGWGGPASPTKCQRLDAAWCAAQTPSAEVLPSGAPGRDYRLKGGLFPSDGKRCPVLPPDKSRYATRWARYLAEAWANSKSAPR